MALSIELAVARGPQTAPDKAPARAAHTASSPSVTGTPVVKGPLRQRKSITTKLRGGRRGEKRVRGERRKKTV